MGRFQLVHLNNILICATVCLIPSLARFITLIEVLGDAYFRTLSQFAIYKLFYDCIVFFVAFELVCIFLQVELFVFSKDICDGEVFTALKEKIPQVCLNLDSFS